MAHYIIRSVKLVSFILITTLMLACGSNPVRNTYDQRATAKDINALLQRASAASENQKHALLVQAAGLLNRQSRAEKSLELLLSVDSRYLSQNEQDDFHLYYAEALLQSPQDNAHLAALNQLKLITAPQQHQVAWQIRFTQAQSDAQLANHNYFEAAKLRIELDDLIDNETALIENNDKIWFAISQIEPDFLARLITSFNSQRVNGWLEIVQINQKWGNRPDELLRRKSIWEKRYPLHPAAKVKPTYLQRMANIGEIKPKKIGVLLPLSGRFAKTGKIIHDGLVAANYQQSNAEAAPSITFYDTAKSLSGLASYQQAVDDGADFIIGPLLKSNIEQIVGQEQLDMPMLLLNTISEIPSRHQNIYQFGLPIEEESIQAAHRAWEQGFRKAIAFVPSGARSERAIAAFKKYFEGLGGELLDTQEYKELSKLNSNVEKLLGADKSIARKNEVEQIIGRNIEFVLRRRKDADFIFLIASAKDARRIKPSINYYFALDLPVIATSRVFSGTVDAERDEDLSNIEFSDVPLYISEQADFKNLREQLVNIDPSILKQNNGRFFSLGYDAYQIITHIPKLSAFPDYRWYGLSGELGIDDLGVVHRFLTWAKFEKGTPKITKERLKPDFEPINPMDIPQPYKSPQPSDAASSR